MLFRDFAIMTGVCLLWALNTVLSKILVSDLGIPPLFCGAVRFAIVFLAASPWLFPAPKPWWRLVVVGLCMGGGVFALNFIGLQTATPSSAAIVAQLGVPATTLLSVFVLGEQIHWRRGVGIALSLAGVLIVMWRPEDIALSGGLMLIALSALFGSIGAVTMKQMTGVGPLRFQAWVGLISFIPLAASTAAFEPEAMGIAWQVGWPLAAIMVFSALVVSLGAHSAYYHLIQRYEANLIAPLTLMMPLFTIALGVMITGDRIDAWMALGTLVALSGVLIIALRRDHVAPLIQLLRWRI